jgi:hypothetical protein
MTVCGDARRFLRENHNPAPRSAKEPRRPTRCKTPRGLRRSRKRSAASVVASALGRRRRGCIFGCGRVEKRVRVCCTLFNGRVQGATGKKPRRGKNPRGQRPPFQLIPERRYVSLRRAKPWGGDVAFASVQPREGEGARESVRRIRGKRPRRGNPMSGTGMKQARQVVRGAKRRRGAKPQGRNVTCAVEAHGI